MPSYGVPVASPVMMQAAPAAPAYFQAAPAAPAYFQAASAAPAYFQAAPAAPAYFQAAPAAPSFAFQAAPTVPAFAFQAAPAAPAMTLQLVPSAPTAPPAAPASPGGQMDCNQALQKITKEIEVLKDVIDQHSDYIKTHEMRLMRIEDYLSNSDNLKKPLDVLADMDKLKEATKDLPKKKM